MACKYFRLQTYIPQEIVAKWTGKLCLKSNRHNFFNFFLILGWKLTKINNFSSLWLELNENNLSKHNYTVKFGNNERLLANEIPKVHKNCVDWCKKKREKQNSAKTACQQEINIGLHKKSTKHWIEWNSKKSTKFRIWVHQRISCFIRTFRWGMWMNQMIYFMDCGWTHKM